MIDANGIFPGSLWFLTHKYDCGWQDGGWGRCRHSSFYLLKGKNEHVHSDSRDAKILKGIQTETLRHKQWHSLLKLVAKAVIKKWTLIGTLPNLHVLILSLVNVHKTAMVLPGPRLPNGCWGRDAAGLFRWTCGAKLRHLVSINPFVNGYKIISHLLCWKQGRTLLASRPMNEERLSKSI